MISIILTKNKLKWYNVKILVYPHLSLTERSWYYICWAFFKYKNVVIGDVSIKKEHPPECSGVFVSFEFDFLRPAPPPRPTSVLLLNSRRQLRVGGCLGLSSSF